MTLLVYFIRGKNACVTSYAVTRQWKHFRIVLRHVQFGSFAPSLTYTWCHHSPVVVLFHLCLTLSAGTAGEYQKYQRYQLTVYCYQRYQQKSMTKWISAVPLAWWVPVYCYQTETVPPTPLPLSPLTPSQHQPAAGLCCRLEQTKS